MKSTNTVKQSLLDANFEVIKTSMVGFNVFNIGNYYNYTPDNLFRLDVVADSNHFRDIYYLIYYENELIAYGYYEEDRDILYNTEYVDIEAERKIHVMYEEVVEREKIKGIKNFIRDIKYILKQDKIKEEIADLGIENRIPNNFIKVTYKKEPSWDVAYAENQVYKGLFLLYVRYKGEYGEGPLKLGWHNRSEIEMLD